MAQTANKMASPAESFDPIASTRPHGSNRNKPALPETPKTDERMREYVQNIAVQHARTKTHETTTRHCDILPADFDHGFSSNLVLGDAILNVGRYFDSRKADGVARDSFMKFKAVPEYAIERTGLLFGMRKNSSYFDDIHEDFRRAPERIARDPRFRN